MKPGEMSSQKELYNPVFFILLLAFIAVLGPPLIKHHKIVHDPWVINDDQRQQIFEFYREEGTPVFKDDYIANYYLDTNIPLGFSLLYSIAGYIWDPLEFSRYLQEVLFILLLLFLFLIGKTLGGSITGLLCLLAAFCSYIYLDRIAGGLPRAFSYPLVAGFLWGLLRRDLRLMALMLLLQALFYPPPLLPCGITFFFFLLFSKSLPLTTRKRFLILILTVTMAGAAVVPKIFPVSSQYGERITLSNMHLYPETGPEGRYGPEDRPPFPSLAEQIIHSVKSSFTGSGIVRADTVIKGSLILLGAFGWILWMLRKRQVWILVFFLSASLAYELACLAYSYLHLPQRAFLYTLPILLHTGLVIGLYEVSRTVFVRIPTTKKIDSTILSAILVFLILIVFLIDRTFPGKGLYSEEGNKDLFLYIRNHIPKKAIIAGWPQDVDTIPLLSRRRILVGYETYQAFHTGYTLQMRKRASAVIDAYLSDDLEALRRLHTEFGVTHLLLNWYHFHVPPIELPFFFAPHDKKVISLLSSVPLRERAVMKIYKKLEIARVGHFSILELSRLREISP